MDGDFRTVAGAGRLQRTFAMRLLRVASAGVLSLAAMLLWKGLEPSAPRASLAAGARAIATLVTHDAGATAALERRTPDHKEAQPAHVGGLQPLLVRSRATDGDGDPAPLSALASSTTAPLGSVVQSTRAHLRRLALGHAPSGEPSPFDATAPPASRPRNG
jgi:hypothetical protein